MRFSYEGQAGAVSAADVNHPIAIHDFTDEEKVKQARPNTGFREAESFLSGWANGALNEAQGQLFFLASPGAVNESLIRGGAAVDTAVDYYLEKLKPGGLQRMASDLALVNRCLTDGVERYETLPPEEQGKVSGAIGFNIITCEFGAIADLEFAKATERIFDSWHEIACDPLRSWQLRGVSGAGGEWPLLNERVAADVIKQTEPHSCVAACAEMLTNGRVTQSELNRQFDNKIVDPGWLASALGSRYVVGSLGERSMFEELLRLNRPFCAELRDEKLWGTRSPSHMVMVDGCDRNGLVKIRDPLHGTRYEMTLANFEHVWTGRGVFEKNRR